VLLYTCRSTSCMTGHRLQQARSEMVNPPNRVDRSHATSLSSTPQGLHAVHQWLLFPFFLDLFHHSKPWCQKSPLFWPRNEALAYGPGTYGKVAICMEHFLRRYIEETWRAKQNAGAGTFTTSLVDGGSYTLERACMRQGCSLALWRCGWLVATSWDLSKQETMAMT
jgi:hypothetical protein